MRLPDRFYDIAKWICMVVIPACTTAYVGLSAIWGWPYATEIAKTSAVICTLLGALLGISTAQYNKDNYLTGDIDERFWPDEDDEASDPVPDPEEVDE